MDTLNLNKSFYHIDLYDKRNNLYYGENRFDLKSKWAADGLHILFLTAFVLSMVSGNGLTAWSTPLLVLNIILLVDLIYESLTKKYTLSLFGRAHVEVNPININYKKSAFSQGLKYPWEQVEQVRFTPLTIEFSLKDHATLLIPIENLHDNVYQELAGTLKAICDTREIQMSGNIP